MSLLYILQHHIIEPPMSLLYILQHHIIEPPMSLQSYPVKSTEKELKRDRVNNTCCSWLEDRWGGDTPCWHAEHTEVRKRKEKLSRPIRRQGGRRRGIQGGDAWITTWPVWERYCVNKEKGWTTWNGQHNTSLYMCSLDLHPDRRY
jgi:hypothetical protein